MGKLATLDYVAITAYMLIMVGVGLFFSWFIRDIKGYFKGGNAIPWVVSAISNFMGLFSTFVFIAYAGVAYESGLVGVTVLWCTVPPCLFAAWLMGKKWLRAGILTPIEYLETRFSPAVRQLFGWTGLGMRFLDNMVRLYAIGIFLVTASSLSFEEAILVAGLIITLFTIAGGVWAVVVMDTVQFIILVFSSFLLIPLVLDATGGLVPLVEKYPGHFQWFNGPKGQPLWLVAYYIMILLKYNGNWVFIQRFYSVKDEKAARNLGLLSALLFFIFPLVFLFPAIAAIDILPDLADPEMAYVAVAVQLLPAGLMGLMIASMFSATMSSLNSEFNVMSAVLTSDIYKRLINPQADDKTLVRAARINVLIIGAIIMAGALFVGQLGGAFEANKLFTGLFGIPIAIPLIFGLLVRKTNAQGAFLSIGLGITSGLIFNIGLGLSWETATLLEIGICLLTFLLSGHLFPSKASYQTRVNQLFAKLNTPLQAPVMEDPDPKFHNALMLVFVLAIAISGILFMTMGLPSLSVYSGKVAMVIGALCLMLAGWIKWKWAPTTPKEK